MLGASDYILSLNLSYTLSPKPQTLDLIPQAPPFFILIEIHIYIYIYTYIYVCVCFTAHISRSKRTLSLKTTLKCNPLNPKR